MSAAVMHPFVEALVAGGRTLPASTASWLNTRRAAALERANALSAPTPRDEEWRFTDLAPLNRLRVVPAAAGASVDVAPFTVSEAGVRLTFVDGVYVPALSSPGALAAGVTVGTLAETLKTKPALIEQIGRAHV